VRLFDSHAHVGAPELLSEAPELIARARAAGVQGMLAVGAGYGIGANAGAVMLAQENPGIWASVGVHPHDAAEWSPIAETALEAWLAHSRVARSANAGSTIGTSIRRATRKSRRCARRSEWRAQPTGRS
jgi:TatD DNase family protein